MCAAAPRPQFLFLRLTNKCLSCLTEGRRPSGHLGLALEDVAQKPNELFRNIQLIKMLWNVVVQHCLDAHLAVVAVFPSLPPCGGPHSPGQLRFLFPATSASTFLPRPSQIWGYFFQSHPAMGSWACLNPQSWIVAESLDTYRVIQTKWKFSDPTYFCCRWSNPEILWRGKSHDPLV